MTIIDVFLHDPLYHWTKQSTENENVNLEAKRVRLRVQQKLHGFEGGEKQTTEGQVLNWTFQFILLVCAVVAMVFSCASKHVSVNR